MQNQQRCAMRIAAILFLGATSLAAAQQDPTMQSMPGMQAQHPAAHSEPMDSSTPGHGAIPPAADLLAEAHDREALTLSEIEQIAMTANPGLLRAEGAARRSGAQARQAGLYPNPSIGYQGDQIRGGSYGGGEQGGFIQQTIVLGNKLGLDRDALTQRQAADTIAVATERVRIRSEVRQLFASALAAQAGVELGRQFVDLSNETLRTALRLANIGQADQPDILQAEVEAGEAGIAYARAQRDYIGRFRSLTALAGRPDLPLTRVAGALSAVPVIDTDGVTASILRENPAVLYARQQAVRAAAELKSAEHAAVPDLDLRAGLQQNHERLEGSGRSTGLQGFASAGITLPIFNRNQGGIDAARAAIEIAEQERLRVERRVRQKAAMLIEQHRASSEEATLYRTQLLPRAQHALELYLDRYQQMAGAYSSVLVAQKTLFELQSKNISALAQAWRTAIELEDFTLEPAAE